MEGVEWLIKDHEGTPSVRDQQQTARSVIMADRSMTPEDRREMALEVEASIETLSKSNKKKLYVKDEIKDIIVDLYRKGQHADAREKANELCARSVPAETIRTWCKKAIPITIQGELKWVYPRIPMGRPRDMPKPIENFARERLLQFLQKGVRITSLTAQYGKPVQGLFLLFRLCN